MGDRDYSGMWGYSDNLCFKSQKSGDPFGQLNLANYLMQIRLDLEGLKI